MGAPSAPRCLVAASFLLMPSEEGGEIHPGCCPHLGPREGAVVGLESHPHSSTFPSRSFFSFTAQPQPGFLPHRCALRPPALPTSTEALPFSEALRAPRGKSAERGGCPSVPGAWEPQAGPLQSVTGAEAPEATRAPVPGTAPLGLGHRVTTTSRPAQAMGDSWGLPPARPPGEEPRRAPWATCLFPNRDPCQAPRPRARRPPGLSPEPPAGPRPGPPRRRLPRRWPGL